MDRPSRIPLWRIAPVNFICAGISNDFRSNIVLTQSKIMKHIQDEVYNSVSEVRTSDVSMYTLTSLPELASEDESLQQKEPFVKGHKNEPEIPQTIPDIKCPAKEINFRNVGTLFTIAVSPLSKRCTSTNEKSNIPLPPEVFCKMCPSSMISDDLPPVLHLHKKPIAVTFPANMSCIISPRPMRSGAPKTIV